MAEQRVTEADIRAVLAGTHGTVGTNIWLYNRNANLHLWRPADMLDVGGQMALAVLAEAERVAGAM